MSISEVKVGSLIRVKVGRNIILAKVVEILDGAVRVCSLANNREFNVPQSRVQLDGEQSSTEAQGETTVQTEEAGAEQQTEQEAQTEQAETTEEAAETEAEETGTPATVEVVPEDEAAEFTPSGEDEEDEYVINPAHESDKPVKRLSLLNAAVIVLKDAGPEHPMRSEEHHV